MAIRERIHAARVQLISTVEPATKSLNSEEVAKAASDQRDVARELSGIAIEMMRAQKTERSRRLFRIADAVKLTARHAEDRALDLHEEAETVYGANPAGPNIASLVRRTSGTKDSITTVMRLTLGGHD